MSIVTWSTSTDQAEYQKIPRFLFAAGDHQCYSSSLMPLAPTTLIFLHPIPLLHRPDAVRLPPNTYCERVSWCSPTSLGCRRRRVQKRKGGRYSNMSISRSCDIVRRWAGVVRPIRHYKLIPHSRPIIQIKQSIRIYFKWFGSLKISRVNSTFYPLVCLFDTNYPHLTSFHPNYPI